MDIRVIIKENNLQELALQLPVEGESFLNYMRSIRELHSAVVASEYSYSRCESAVFNFETNFWYLHKAYTLPMTLKCHVIIDHYLWYFREMGTNFHDTNGEYVEALHYSLDGFEEMKKLKVKRQLGSDGHLKKSLISHISYNSLRVGSPNRVMSLRKSTPKQSPLQK